MPPLDEPRPQPRAPLEAPRREPGVRPRGTTLIVLPHPDDEFFAAGFLENEGAHPTQLIWLSCGGFLPALRAGEMESTARWMDDSGVRCSQAGFRDGRLRKDMPDILAYLDRALAASRAEVVVTTEAEGVHRDHDAAFAACMALVHRRFTLVTVPCYSWSGRLRVASPKHKSADWKMDRPGAFLERTRGRIVRSYPSQWFMLLPLLLAGGRSCLSSQYWRVAYEPPGGSPADSRI